MEIIKNEPLKKSVSDSIDDQKVNWSLIFVKIFTMVIIFGPFIIMLIDLFSKN